MSQGNLIAASTAISNATDGQWNDNRQCFVMSDGQHVALFGPDGASILQYATSADGVTWSAPASLYNLTGTSTAITGATQNGDAILLSGNANNGDGMVFYPLTYSTSAKTLAGPGYGFSAVSTPLQCETAWDSGFSVYHLATAGGNQISIGAYSGGSSPPALLRVYNGVAPAVLGIRCYTASGTTTVLILFSDSGALYVAPMTYNGSSYSLGAVETAATQSIAGGACSLDSSNALDIVYVSGSALYALRRTGTKVYSSTVNLAGSVGSGVISTVTNGADLVVLYQSTVNQANGEIYLVWRTSGVWGNPTRFAGGDSGGYSVPKGTPAIVSGVLNAIYQASGGVYALATQASSAPNAPTITAPSGSVAGLTPTITETYSNTSAPTDTQSALEIKVTNGATTMWDSGKVNQTGGSIVYGQNSNTSDPNYVAPAALAYGTQYSVQARTWDVVSNSVSAWSTAVTFTPYQAGTATITQIVDSGTTSTASPVTITSSTISSTTVSWSQPQSDAASQWQERIYANDGVTLLFSTAWTTFATNLASGSSATLPSWSPNLANSTTYQLAVALQDATSGVVSESAHWTLTSAWTPPPGVTGLTATPQAAAGSMLLAWTNPNGTASDIVQRAPTGTTDWTVLSADTLLTTLTDYPPLLTGFDYQVIAVTSSGVQAAAVTASDVQLGANGIFGVWFHDSTDPSVAMCFGPIDTWQDASQFDSPSDVLSYVPLGGSTPIISARLQFYRATTQRKFVVPDSATDAAGNPVIGKATIATMYAMQQAGNPILFRDIRGSSFYVRITNGHDEVWNWPLLLVQMDLTEVVGPLLPLTS